MREGRDGGLQRVVGRDARLGCTVFHTERPVLALAEAVIGHDLHQLDRKRREKRGDRFRLSVVVWRDKGIAHDQALAERRQSFQIFQDPLVPDAGQAPVQIGLDLGWGGLLAKIRHYRAKLSPADTSFYDMEEETVLGIQTYVENVAAEAERMAGLETDENAKKNLLEIAAMNRYLVSAPPRTIGDR